MRQIECHLARANPHWKDLAKGGEAMMIFQARAVTSRRTGIRPGATGKAVPTWNYAIVHAYERPAIMNDKDWLQAPRHGALRRPGRTEAHPWKVSDAPESSST